MTPRLNEFGQPIGDPVDWSPREPLQPVTLVGRWSRVEPLARHHVDQLHRSLVLESPPSIWTYLAAGPFDDKAGFSSWLAGHHDDPRLVTHALCLPDGRPLGLASYLREDRANGSVEVGWVAMSAELQRTTPATEVMHLMARHVFDTLGYRRYEWKCDSLNAPSRRAARRLGFSYEGRFRKAMVYNDRNRDTDWFSITDDEWPAVRAATEAWLAPENFVDGAQQRRLQAPRRAGEMPDPAS